jgi:Xaa-Pro aminopeptidase
MKFDLAARRERIAKALDLKDEVLLIGAGEPVGMPGGQDQTYPFVSHAEYFYLTDAECEGGVVAFDPKDGHRSGWTDFVPVVTQSQKVWEGRDQVPGTPLPELAAWMAARRGRPVVMLGTPLAGIKHDARRSEEVREVFTHARRPKEAAEIARMKQAVAATAPAYARVRALLAEAASGACISERLLKAEIECAFGRHHGDGPAYGTIVGVASNGAVLHFDPTERAAKPGDLVLIDAGSLVNRYASDVTRTFACGPVDTARKELHALVHRAFERAIARCVIGAEWIDVHVGAAVDMAEGLVQMGVLKGSATSAVESGAMGLFYPHGLGHLIGLGVRDASGRMPGRVPSKRAGVITIRCDFPLAAGYTITVEPGCYFIAPLLNDPENRSKHKDSVNWGMVDTLLASGIGGVRIEDNIHITEKGPENLTGAIPTGM